MLHKHVVPVRTNRDGLGPLGTVDHHLLAEYRSTFGEGNTGTRRARRWLRHHRRALEHNWRIAKGRCL